MFNSTKQETVNQDRRKLVVNDKSAAELAKSAVAALAEIAGQTARGPEPAAPLFEGVSNKKLFLIGGGALALVLLVAVLKK